MKNSKSIILTLLLTVLLAGCSGGGKTNILRPYDTFTQYTVKKFKGEKLTGINVDAAADFRRAIAGRSGCGG